MLLRLTLLSLVLLALHSPAFGAPRYRGVQIGADLSAQDLGVLSAWRPNLVRYQLHWSDFDAADAADEAAYNVWLDSALDNFEALIPTFQQYGMKIALNLHTPPGGFTRRDSQATHRVFTEQWAQDAFIRAWEKIATRFKDSSVIWAYDLLNEPAQFSKVSPPLKDWNALGKQAALVVRGIDPGRTIITGPRYYNARYIDKLKPLGMPNVVYTIHFYEPFKFLHQGFFGLPLGVSYPTKKSNKKSLLKALEKVDAFQKKNKKSQIYVGEFSVIRWAPGDSAAKYLNDILSIFEKKKWHWTYHAFRDANAWSVEHSSTREDNTRSSTPTDRYNILTGYLGRNP